MSGGPSARECFRLSHLPKLDGLRGLAVLLVLVGHWAHFSDKRFDAAGSLAGLGVTLFFVLSGFLITCLLLREREESGQLDLKAFYVRRILRLAPALLIFITAVAILSRLKLITDTQPHEFVVCLLYVRNIFGRSQSLGHLWSLSLEEQFYTLWPWIVRLTPQPRILTIAVAGTLAIATGRTIGIMRHWAPYDNGVFYERPWFRFDSILAGCCLAIALTEGDRPARILKGLVARIHPAIIWGTLIAWTILGEQISRPLFLTLQVSLAAMATAKLAISPTPSAVFSNRYARFLGKISYGLYLWQQPFLVVQGPNWGILRKFPSNFAAPVMCALISCYAAERPALRLKKYWRSAGAPCPETELSIGNTPPSIARSIQLPGSTLGTHAAPPSHPSNSRTAHNEFR